MQSLPTALWRNALDVRGEPVMMKFSERAVAMKVKGAAIRHKNGRLWWRPPPMRHHNLIHLIVQEGEFKQVKGPDFSQGFVTTDGTFVTRDLAEKIARRAGQLTKPLIGSILTSEDLW